MDVVEDKEKWVNPKDLLDENFDVKGDIKTFVNPLLYDTDEAETIGEFNRLEAQKVKLKFKRDLILENKLKKLKKLSALETQKQILAKEIEKLKRL